jgi:hypothetical protein
MMRQTDRQTDRQGSGLRVGYEKKKRRPHLFKFSFIHTMMKRKVS